MENISDLRAKLIAYVRKKFYTRQGIGNVAEDIVNQAFLDVANSPKFASALYNFGYLSAACIRGAYKIFHKHDNEGNICIALTPDIPLIDESDFVEEITRAEDTAAIIASLQTLKEMERTIVHERYYGDYTFREISERHGIKLNTVLTHHRRALEKLRPLFMDWRN
ncbi:MAG: sigma-70 family RNA polymerase sigma factor [Defluviitaleaceae bacterium]|nr:sigma-70 family RNA polymerase sigma factor [Defluviitaleaceae bacterium]MCL2275693.1 sigma-70 family RNA polymerase sigma factor [Defluviitaleaceae bacterium]